jgi:ubiquinone/menaquinone biosynthesis C-methylase UbiE
VKLDFGAGNNCREGFESVDLYLPGAKYQIDLTSFPFPWPDESVEEINCSHFLEHIPKEKRWPFFEECYRILKPEGKMHINVPNWKSERAYGDMTHEWPPVSTMMFWYLNKNWREQNKLTYGPYDIKCNFDVNAGPSGIVPQFAQRSYDAQVFVTTHYMESYMDMWVILTKR